MCVCGGGGGGGDCAYPVLDVCSVEHIIISILLTFICLDQR